jgi:hypothetical protein
MPKVGIFMIGEKILAQALFTSPLILCTLFEGKKERIPATVTQEIDHNIQLLVLFVQ